MTTLPFLTTATLKSTDGTVIKDVPCSIWAARGGNTDVGRQYDHEGQAPKAFADDLVVANRYLETGGRRYRIVEAVPFSLLPHVSLRLREMRSASA
jgi:hypothetical protein